MLPEAKNGDLLYISDFDRVYVYTYPNETLVGTLNDGGGFGECADSTGNVFVVNEYQTLEYAHGGTTPIQTLPNPYGNDNPQSCAVAPGSNDLAVTNVGYVYDGIVLVYPNESGPPIRYYKFQPVRFNPYYCTYDAAGNLFVLGDTDIYSAPNAVEELVKGNHRFVRVRMRKAEDVSVGGILWDGKHFVLGGSSGVYGYELRDGVFHQQSAIGLTGAEVEWGFWIQGKHIIVPSYNLVLTYPYPAGGDAIKTLSGFNEPTGAVVSVASSGSHVRK